MTRTTGVSRVGACLESAQTGYTPRMTSDLLINSPWADKTGGVNTPAERAEAERMQHDRERLRAARVIAARAQDVTQARDLLAMVGLTSDDIRAALGQHTTAA
jgi:hypothetical protein